LYSLSLRPPRTRPILFPYTTLFRSLESSATDSGSFRVTVSFEIGTDPDQATINVNNRVQQALARLPQSVRDQGLKVEARSTSILDRKSTRLNSSHVKISYAVFCLKK